VISIVKRNSCVATIVPTIVLRLQRSEFAHRAGFPRRKAGVSRWWNRWLSETDSDVRIKRDSHQEADASRWLFVLRPRAAPSLRLSTVGSRLL